MQRKLLIISSMILAAILFTSLSSAYTYRYGYGEDYKQEHYIKKTYNIDGYSYVEKNVQKDPWGEKISYTKITDYDGYNYRYPAYNKVVSYWDTGNKPSWTYVDYSYSDAYNRGYYGSNYYDYYYSPHSYSGSWDWHYSGCRSSYCY